MNPELRFKDQDGNAFPDWEEKKIKEIGEVCSGGTPNTNEPKFWNGEIQWFTPSEVGKDKYVYNSLRTISASGLKKSSACILPINTLLVSTRATLGEISIAKKECSTNQGFHPIIVNNDNDNEFIYYCSPIIKKYCFDVTAHMSCHQTDFFICQETAHICVIYCLGRQITCLPMNYRLTCLDSSMIA